MQKAQSHVIKGDQVKIEGTYLLGASSGAENPGNLKKNNSPPAQPQAGIVEKNNDFATVEIVCSCGRKIQLKCVYENPQSSDIKS